jgi:hypothetical protein
MYEGKLGKFNEHALSKLYNQSTHLWSYVIRSADNLDARKAPPNKTIKRHLWYNNFDCHLWLN